MNNCTNRTNRCIAQITGYTVSVEGTTSSTLVTLLYQPLQLQYFIPSQSVISKSIEMCDLLLLTTSFQIRILDNISLCYPNARKMASYNDPTHQARYRTHEVSTANPTSADTYEYHAKFTNEVSAYVSRVTASLPISNTTSYI